jgi:hypothetical protein
MTETNSIALEISASSQNLVNIQRKARLACINKTEDELAGTISYTFSDGSILHFPLNPDHKGSFKVTAGA